MSDDSASIQAREHLRAHREGVLIADGLAGRIRFIIESATGRIVFPCTPVTAEAAELVLFIPEEDPRDAPELQLLLAPAPLDPGRDAACDRYQAYHGEPRLTRWLGCSVESARFAGEVVEPDPLNEPSRMAKTEPSLCRLLNTDRVRLAAICKAHAGVAPREPLVVGVDDTGIDVRARFGIIRIALPEQVTEPAQAEATIRAMLENPGK